MGQISTVVEIPSRYRVFEVVDGTNVDEICMPHWQFWKPSRGIRG
jgi:hypothetical protein